VAVTQEQVADHLDLSGQRFRTIMNKGDLPKWNKETATYDRVAYIRHMRAIASGRKSPEGKLDLTAERRILFLPA